MRTVRTFARQPGGRRLAAAVALGLSLALSPGCGDGDDGDTDDADGRDGDGPVEAEADDGAPGDDARTEDGPPSDDGAGDDGAVDDGGGCTTPDTVTATYGNGAFALTGNWSYARMAVHLTGCGGRPVAGGGVTWAVVDGIGVISEDWSSPPATTLTVNADENGVARAVFRCPSSMPNPSDSRNAGRVRATVGASSVDYVVTAFNSCPIAGCGSAPPFQPSILVVTPEGYDLGTHGVGDTITAGIRVQVANQTGWEMGRPAPDVGARLVEPDDSSPEFRPSTVATCANGDATGTVLSAATGIASCDVRVIGGSGRSAVRLLVGESIYWNIWLDVTP